MLIDHLRSWQLPHKLNVGGEEGTLLAWPTTAASPQITMVIHISNWTHKFQNRTGLDAKTNSELYKSNRVCSARQASLHSFLQYPVGRAHGFGLEKNVACSDRVGLTSVEDLTPRAFHFNLSHQILFYSGFELMSF